MGNPYWNALDIEAGSALLVLSGGGGGGGGGGLSCVALDPSSKIK